MTMMMHEAWFYVVLMTLLVVLTAVPLVAVRVIAARQEREAPRPHVPRLP